MTSRSISTVAAIAAAVGLVATASAMPAAQELPKVPNDNVPARPLAAATTYTAVEFPLHVRVTTPDASWLGGQWKLETLKRGSYGYIEFLQRPAANPLGAMWIIASFDKAAGVAATVAKLRAGVGASFGAATTTKLAGFSGSQFDGEVTAKHHVFIPFTAVTHAASFHPDAYQFDQGEVFRVVVLNVRGRTVVILRENAALLADQFPDFLAKADRLLATLQFPS